jgi:predicted nucleotidyltransferase
MEQQRATDMERNVSRDALVRQLLAHRTEIMSFGVRSLALFGSAARDQASPDSDIDVLVDFEEPATFDRYMDLRIFLEDLTGRRIDLVTRKSLRPQLRPQIEREAIVVA